MATDEDDTHVTPPPPPLLLPPPLLPPPPSAPPSRVCGCSPSGFIIMGGTHFLGRADITIEHGDGAASLSNTVTLDCSFCKQAELVGTLSWEELISATPSAPQLLDGIVFCTCPAPSNGSQVIASLIAPDCT